MGLTPQQEVAASFLAEKSQEETYADIAERVGVTEKTLYNWRKDEEFQEAVARASGTTVDKALVKAINEDNTNAALYNVYYKRFGFFREEDKPELSKMLQMTDDERNRIEQYILRKHGVGTD